MKRTIVFFFFLVFICSSVSAQKVGLVLSGGGAKGLAHIGVIKALEENHIPIDYITGTSMGAIVGGLYAAGYTPGEMEAIFKSQDFKEWSNGIIPEKYR
jgi:NTE family protein